MHRTPPNKHVNAYQSDTIRMSVSGNLNNGSNTTPAILYCYSQPFQAVYCKQLQPYALAIYDT
jgi:hypothetical protein